LIDIVLRHQNQARVNRSRHPIANPGVKASGPDGIIVPGVEQEKRQVVHDVVVLHRDQLRFSFFNIVQKFSTGLIDCHNQFSGSAGLVEGCDDPRPSLGVKTDHPSKVWVGCQQGRGFLGCDVGL
jgi:hypothetical protein